MWQEVLKFIFDTISSISDFWNWLTSDIEIGSWDIKPIAILGITGFVIIMGFWIFKLVNPLS